MQPEPPATTNGSCRMSRDIVWLSDGGDLGDLQLTIFVNQLIGQRVAHSFWPDKRPPGFWGALASQIFRGF